MKTPGMGLAVALIAGGISMSHDAHAQQPGTRRVELQRHDLSVPGREVVQLRVDFDPGASFPRHRHPGEEIIYVIEGTIEYQVDGSPAKVYKTGEVLTVPTGVIHSAKNVGNDNAAELGTYFVEKGKPLVEIVK
jgi:quercetin dioxygenase-like cupin family protein